MVGVCHAVSPGSPVGPMLLHLVVVRADLYGYAVPFVGCDQYLKAAPPAASSAAVPVILFHRPFSLRAVLYVSAVLLTSSLFLSSAIFVLATQYRMPACMRRRQLSDVVVRCRCRSVMLFSQVSEHPRCFFADSLLLHNTTSRR